MNDPRKTTAPQALQDQELDQASGGIIAVRPAAPEAIISDKATPKLAKGEIKAGDGSV